MLVITSTFNVNNKMGANPFDSKNLVVYSRKPEGGRGLH